MKRSCAYDTVIGSISVTEENGTVTAVTFGDNGGRDETALTLRTAEQLREYLSGERKEFDLPLAPRGTAFQKRIWNELLNIPYGGTTSYGELADAAGSPRGARAAGMGCNKNPIAVIIPCHRVVGKRGKLTGYAGGIDIKTRLLQLERENVR